MRRLLALPALLALLTIIPSTASADVAVNGCTARIWKPSFPWYDANNIQVRSEIDIVCTDSQTWDLTISQREHIGSNWSLVPNVSHAQAGIGSRTVTIQPTTPRYYYGTRFDAFKTVALRFNSGGRAATAIDDRGYESNPTPAP